MRLYRVLFAVVFGVAVYANDATGTPGDEFSGALKLQHNGVAPLTLKGSIEQGGDVMTFNGTAQEIEAQIRHIKPDFTWQDFHPAKAAGASRSAGSQLGPRLWSTEIHCPILDGHMFGYNSSLKAAHDWLVELNYLIPVDGGMCNKIWCKKLGALWACNDNPGWKGIHSLDLAALTDEIYHNDKCTGLIDPPMMQGNASELYYHYHIMFEGDTSCLDA